MRKLGILILLAAGVAAVVYGLRRVSSTSGSPESTVEDYYAARKRGDVLAVLECVDLKGAYKRENTATISFGEYQNTVRIALGLAFAFERKAVRDAFQYEVLGARRSGSDTVVKVRTRPDPASPWVSSEVPVRPADGRWKITPEGFDRLIEEMKPQPDAASQPPDE